MDKCTCKKTFVRVKKSDHSESYSKAEDIRFQGKYIAGDNHIFLSVAWNLIEYVSARVFNNSLFITHSYFKCQHLICSECNKIILTEEEVLSICRLVKFSSSPKEDTYHYLRFVYSDLVYDVTRFCDKGSDCHSL